MDHRALMAAGLLLGCAPAAVPEPAAPVGEPDFEHAFSFAILADPHVVSATGNADRLRTAVAWIDAQAEERSIELVLVLGDIGWSAGLQVSHDVLAELTMPWVPVLGDNEIQFGDEQRFDAVFGPVYEGLGDELDDFVRAPVRAWNPERETDSWFQNAAFSHRGVRFVALDWSSRVLGNLLGETADLHDFQGGSFPFFVQQVGGMGAGAFEDTILLSHHPMHVPSFTQGELGSVASVTWPHRDRVFGAFGGHYHGNGEEEVEGTGYTAWVTDAVFDDELTIRVVDVWGNGVRFDYEQELVEL